MKLITSTDCCNCKMLKSMMDSRKIAYDTIDVESIEAKSIIADNGIRTLPVLVNGDSVYVGMAECLKVI